MAAGGRGSFRGQLAGLLAAVLVSAVALLVIDDWERRQSAAELAQIRNESLATLRLAKSVSDLYGFDVADTTFRVRSGLITWEEGRVFVRQARERLEEEWPELRALAERGEREALMFALLDVRERADATAAELARLLETEDMVALGAFADRRLYPGIDPVTLRLRALVRDEEARADRLVRRAAARDARIARYRLAGTGAILLVLGVIGWRMLRSTGRAVDALTGFATAIESGDFASPPPPRPPGEAGLVMDAMLSMREELAASRRDMDHRLAFTEQQSQVIEQRESMQRALLQAAQVAVIALDESFNVVAFNPFAEALTGYSASEVLGGRLPLLHRDAEVRAVAEALSERLGPPPENLLRFFLTLAEAELPPREWTYLRKDGSEVPVLLSLCVIRGEAGQRLGYLSVATDLAPLKALERRMQSLVEAAQVAVMSADLDGKCTAINPFAEALTGYAEHEVKGRSLAALLIDPEEFAAAKAAMSARVGRPVESGLDYFREAMRLGEASREWTFLRKDGRRVPVLVANSPIRDHAGAVVGFLGVATDLSEQKALEARLRDSEAKAHQASLAKSNFLASMSHEIRTPLIGVTGMLEVLAHKHLDADQRSIVDVIQTSAAALIQIVGDVLDFSKIEADRLALDPQPTDVATLLRETTSHFEASASSRGLLLEAQVEGPLAPAYLLDALRLRQIVSNLLSNALKFTEVGRVTARLWQEGDALHFDVIDTGIGISPEQQAQLFAPFQQAEGGTTRRFGGTGLGLAISRQLARLMGGELSMDSTPGTGTTMHLRLPAAPCRPLPAASAPVSMAPQPRPVPTREAAHAAGRLVLLVDDHPTNRLVIGRQLALAGYACDTAVDGEEALARWREGGYGLILTDLHMPRMDGYALALAVRADEVLRGMARTPIVALTAAVTAEDIARCESVGIDRHLAKPSTVPQIRQALDALLGAPPPSSAPLDRATLAALADTAEARRALFEEFLESCEADVRALRESLPQSPEDACRHAHRLKGAARLVGAIALAEVAERIEDELRSHGASDLAPLEEAIRTLREDRSGWE